MYVHLGPLGPISSNHQKGKGKGKEEIFFLSVGGFSPSRHFLQQTPRTTPDKCRRRLPEIFQTDFMYLIYANMTQNKLNIAKYINNLNSVAKNIQEYLNSLSVHTQIL